MDLGYLGDLGRLGGLVETWGGLGGLGVTWVDLGYLGDLGRLGGLVETCGGTWAPGGFVRLCGSEEGSAGGGVRLPRFTSGRIRVFLGCLSSVVSIPRRCAHRFYAIDIYIFIHIYIHISESISICVVWDLPASATLILRSPKCVAFFTALPVPY